MKNRSTTITQRRGNHGDHLAMLQHRQPNRIFMEKNSCCVFGGISLVSCIMSCSNRTRPLLGSLPNTIDEIEPSTQGKTRPLLLQVWGTKLFSCMICSTTCCGAGQNLLRNTQMGSSTPSAVFSRHCSFRLPLVPIDDAWPVWAALHMVWRYQKLYRWLDSLKKWSVLPTRSTWSTRKMGKSSG